jgi:hypothetical protein
MTYTSIRETARYTSLFAPRANLRTEIKHAKKELLVIRKGPQRALSPNQINGQSTARIISRRAPVYLFWRLPRKPLRPSGHRRQVPSCIILLTPPVSQLGGETFDLEYTSTSKLCPNLHHTRYSSSISGLKAHGSESISDPVRIGQE